MPNRNTAFQIDSSPVIGYTKSMKVAISLPDDVFEEGEALARRLKTSRSAVYARALREFTERHNLDGLTSVIDQVLLAAGDEDADFAKEAGRRIMSQSEW